MADFYPLKRDGGVTKEFGASDKLERSTIPAPSVISPSQITSEQDDYSPTGWADANLVLVTFDSSFPGITGFAAGVDGEQKVIANKGTTPGYVACEHPDSTAANRVSGVMEYILEGGGRMVIQYDGTAARWMVVSSSFSPAMLPMCGKGMSYSESAGATNASSFPSLNFSLTSGANSGLASTTTLPAKWGLQVSAVGQGAGLNYTRSGNTISAFGSAHMAAFALLSIDTLSTSAQRFHTSLTITASPQTNTADINNSVGIRHSDNINSGNWQLFSRNNGGTETTADSGVAVAADTLYNLAIYFNAGNTEARFYINGVFVGRIAATMPNAVVCSPRVNVIKQVGSTARDIWVHTFAAFVLYP